MLSHSWKRIAAAIWVMMVAVYASGCIHIQVVDRTPSIVQPTPSTRTQQVEEHNLAVLAVDFDPPLEYNEIMSRKNRGEGITLLVAVENTGSVAEKDIVVEVELSKDKDTTPFLFKQGTIETIVPGEIKLVRFKDTEIPFSYSYQLEVRVAAVNGETQVADNEKRYDLLITQP